MILDDLCDVLSSGGLGTVASTANWGIYKGGLPTTPDKAVAVIETGGLAPVHAMAGSPGKMVAERPRVQVVVRSVATAAGGYSTGRQKINDAYRLLDGFGDRTLNGVHYKWIGAVQAPFPMGEDENARPMFAVNFDVTKALSTA